MSFKDLLRKSLGKLKTLIRLLIYGLGILGLIMLTLAFTDIPYYAYHKLGRTDLMQETNIKTIILLGGDGMPSPSGLIRTYFAQKAAKNNPEANIYIALPRNKDGSLIQLQMMAEELRKNGVPENLIHFEPDGYNTYSQAVKLSRTIPDKNDTILIITSPEHMHRAVLTFKKQGFEAISSLPTFEIPSDEEQLKEKDKKGKKKRGNLSLRYNVWSYLIYEIKVFREYCALLYYKMNGWV